MTTPRPFALRLFVPSGLPEGMRIVEKTNWSGIGFVIPRSQLKEFTQRPEAGRPGVYVLTGPDPEDGGADLAYIGEADPLGRRLEQHQAKEFWTTAYAFTSKDGYLNKAHAQHLEARLIGLAQAAVVADRSRTVGLLESSSRRVSQVATDRLCEEFLFIFQSTSTLEVRVVKLHADALALGTRAVREAIKEYARCAHNGIGSKYARRCDELDLLPFHAMNEDEQLAAQEGFPS